MNLSYHSDPFPHLEGSLDHEFYNYVKSTWVENVEKEYDVATGNRNDILIQDKKIVSILSKLLLDCHSKFTDIFLKEYPKLLKLDSFRLDCRFLYSENKIQQEEYKIRGWHLDNGNKHLVGLWYFKHENENDSGGNLLLLNPLTKDYKEIKYDSNKIVIFPNIPCSWHSITPRKPSEHPRRYINLLLESPSIILHNYKRDPKTVDDEFRGKFFNYYK